MANTDDSTPASDGDEAHSDESDGPRLPVPTDDALPAARERARERAEDGGRWLMNQFSRRLPLDEQLYETVTAAARDQWSVTVNPPKHAEDAVLDAGERFIRSLHGEVERVSIEIHKTREDGIEFHFVAADRDNADRIRQLILTAHPHAEAEIGHSRIPIKQGDHVPRRPRGAHRGSSAAVAQRQQRRRSQSRPAGRRVGHSDRQCRRSMCVSDDRGTDGERLDNPPQPRDAVPPRGPSVVASPARPCESGAVNDIRIRELTGRGSWPFDPSVEVDNGR